MMLSSPVKHKKKGKENNMELFGLHISTWIVIAILCLYIAKKASKITLKRFFRFTKKKASELKKEWDEADKD